MSFVDNAPLELTSHADLLRALNDDSPGRRGRPAFLDKFDAMDQDFVPRRAYLDQQEIKENQSNLRTR